MKGFTGAMGEGVRRVTIHDVAGKAGVSTAAVSHAFNDPERLRATTVTRILAAARELGYAPNPHARALHSQRVGVLGVLFPQPIATVFANPFFASFLEGIGSVTDERGIGLLTVTLDDGAIVRTFVTLAGGDTAFAQAWADGARPTAVLAASDIMAIGAMRAAKRLGLRVPADLEVIGFDDIPLAAASDPALTTVHQPIAEKGRVATRLLIRELDEGGPRERIVLPTELLLRESTRAESTKSRGLGVAKGGTERERKRTLKAAAR